MRTIDPEQRGIPLRLPSFDSLVQDLRYAIRTLRGSPGFTAIAVLILALGIGANTAIFSLVSAVLLKPLPFEQPDRLVLLWENFAALAGPERVEPTPATFVEWKARTQSYEDMALFIGGESFSLTGGGDPEQLSGVRTQTNLFSILGLQPILGRAFLPDDEGPGANPVVVISETLWARRFGADPGLIGRTIDINGLKRTVIGIVAAQFRFPSPTTNVWVPAAFSPDELALRTIFNFDVLARLKPGVSLAAAQAELSTVTETMYRDLAIGNAQPAGTVTPVQSGTVTALQEHLSVGARPTLFILLAAVATILLITCANVANLLLARGAQRQKELAVRKAIGAANGRVLRQLLTESAVLAVGGGVVGVALSTLSFEYLARLMPGTFPGGAGPSLDWRVLVFTALLALVTVLLFGAGPAFTGVRRDVSATLKKGVGASARPGAGRIRNSLVVAEIACTLVLLAAAGLLLRSYAAVLAVDPGFRSDHLLVVETALSPTKYSDISARSELSRRVLERVNALPGVESAGYASLPPLILKGGRVYIGVEGKPAPPPSEFASNIVANRVAGAGYIETLGVPLVSGRLFDSRDGPDGPFTAVVNQTMARRHWPGEDPLGRRFKIGPADAPTPWLTVIGVIGDVHQMGLDTAPEREFYLSADQEVLANATFFWARYLLVRTRVDPLSLAASIRSAIWDIDGDVPVPTVRSMDEMLAAEVASRDTQLTLVGAFAALALLLAAVGLYGVLSYTVAQRTAEIGLRMALGAQVANVVRGVIRGALGLATLGIVLGLAGAFAVTRFMGSFLFGVRPMDPATLAVVAVLLVLVTIVASWVPARRAAGVNPVTALRSE